MLIGDRCYFCLNKKAKFVENKGKEDELHLCSSCHDQYEEIKGNTDKKGVLELPNKDPSEVCRQCGLCCVMLCAKVGKEEGEEFLRQARERNIYPDDITFEQFATLQQLEPYKGQYTINMPCRYLQGSVLKYTGCRGYSLDRPKVCSYYLCKTAVEYKIGRIGQDQAMFSLRSAFMKGDASVFNWSQSLKDLDGYENKISLLGRVSDVVADLRKSKVADDVIEFAVATQITPTYLPSSDVTRILFDMHMFNVDRNEFKLKLYIPDIVGHLNEKEEVLALEVIKQVLRDIRGLFVRGDELSLEKEEKEEEEDAS